MLSASRPSCGVKYFPCHGIGAVSPSSIDWPAEDLSGPRFMSSGQMRQTSIPTRSSLRFGTSHTHCRGAKVSQTLAGAWTSVTSMISSEA